MRMCRNSCHTAALAPASLGSPHSLGHGPAYSAARRLPCLIRAGTLLLWPLSLLVGWCHSVPFTSVFDIHCLSFDFRCDPSEINISDEMPKTTVWKALSINSGNTKEKR